MIPLDRVRELLAALRPRALESLAREEPDWNDLCSYLGCAELFVAAPDLARQVLSLADALTTAERERDEAREIAVALGEVTEWQGRMLARAPTFEDAMALCIEAIVSTAADAPNCAEWRGTMGGREFVLSLQWADGKSPHALLSEARAERDTARSALDGLTAAVREVEESEGALETMIDDSAWTLDDERIAEERVAAAHTALDALLSAAPAPTTVPAPLVRAYLAAEETMRLVAADDHRRDTYHEWAKRHGAAMDAVDAARAALVAGVARCAP